MKTKTIDPDAVDVDYLKQQFNQFRDNMLSMKGKVGANAAEVLDQMSSYLDGNAMSSRLSSLEAELETLASKLKGQGKDVMAMGVAKGKDAMSRVESEVTERPIASIAIAFGMGLLVSQFLRRS